MSAPTTIATARAASEPSSLAASSKFRTFAIGFAVGGVVLYFLCLMFNLPLFTFHPATNRVALGWEAARSGEGPAMYWYGWTATCVLGGAVLGFIGTLLPDSVTRKIPLFLVWLLPILLVPYMIYDLRQWWFHP